MVMKKCQVCWLFLIMTRSLSTFSPGSVRRSSGQSVRRRFTVSKQNKWRCSNSYGCPLTTSTTMAWAVWTLWISCATTTALTTGCRRESGGGLSSFGELEYCWLIVTSPTRHSSSQKSSNQSATMNSARLLLWL